MARGVTVLGAGLAGLAAAQRARELGLSVRIYEKNPYVGGHAYTHGAEGFLFDEGPHVSFTRDEEIRSRFAKAVKGRFHEYRSRILNLWKGHWIPHPAQCHLHGLPIDVVEGCILDLADAVRSSNSMVNSYADWCLQGLGRTFSEEFTFKYTRKYWTTEARNMTVDWVGKRMHKPALREMIRGALSCLAPQAHYLTEFRYPEQGGFSSYVLSVSENQDVELNHTLVAVDLKRRELSFGNGTQSDYDQLVCALPLPIFIDCVKDVPPDVRSAAASLVCTNLDLVNLGIRRELDFPDAQWMYFYDEDISFARANFPHRLSPGNVPKGCGSIQLEVYSSKYRPLGSEDVLNRAVDDARRIGLLDRDDSLVVARHMRIPFANVLYDHEREASLGMVQQFLQSHGVLTCGRYGDWRNYWTDESIRSGWRVVEMAVKREKRA